MTCKPIPSIEYISFEDVAGPIMKVQVSHCWENWGDYCSVLLYLDGHAGIVHYDVEDFMIERARGELLCCRFGRGFGVCVQLIK